MGVKGLFHMALHSQARDLPPELLRLLLDPQERAGSPFLEEFAEAAGTSMPLRTLHRLFEVSGMGAPSLAAPAGWLGLEGVGSLGSKCSLWRLHWDRNPRQRDFEAIISGQAPCKFRTRDG